MNERVPRPPTSQKRHMTSPQALLPSSHRAHWVSFRFVFSTPITQKTPRSLSSSEDIR